jgi:hypothetical protein
MAARTGDAAGGGGSMRAFILGLLLLGCSGEQTGGNSPSLTLSNLQFGFLPINSLRGSVSGYDAAGDRCVTIIWDYSNNHQSGGRHCDDFFPSFPYLYIASGACDGNVHYQANVEMVRASGCIDFADFGAGSTNHVDMEIEVRGDPFTGTIRARNP